MSKIGKIEFIYDCVITFVLLIFFGFYTYLRKYFICFLILQFLCGRYRNQSLLIWEEITLLMESHVFYLIFCIFIAPHTMYTTTYIVKLVIMVLLSFVLCCASSRTLRIAFRNKCKQNILIFGIGQTAEDLASIIRGNRFTLMDVQAFVDCNESNMISTIEQPIVESDSIIDFSEMDEYLSTHNIDTIIFSMPELKRTELDQLMDMVEGKVDNVMFVPKVETSVNFNSNLKNFDGLILINTTLHQNDLIGKVVKRTMDIVAGLVGSLLCIPLTIFVAIYNLLCHDHGPIFFTQKRIGLNGKPFKIYKYRSMVVGADKILEDLMATNPEIRKEYLTNKKLEKDPRVTKAGNFLRKTSLDEFPQFFNVLLGNMSLIGPRPYLFREKKDMGEHYKIIIQSKPGITGMWQTHGRSNLSFKDRLELDEYYYRNWSLNLDIQLLVRTVKTVAGKLGAE